VRPGAGLAAVVAFQLPSASVFRGVLDRPAPHHAPVAVAGAWPLASLTARHGAAMIWLAGVPDAAAARAAVHDGRVNAAVTAGPRGQTLLIATAASPATATVLTTAFGDPTAGTSFATPLPASPGT
jgi:hypothetical protein